MLINFLNGFAAASGVIAWVSGCGCAIVLALAVILVLAAVAGAVFDAVTSFLARRWQRTGRTPRNRVERVILDHRERREANGKL